MQRRKFLATVGSLAAGSAVAIGTGAFSNGQVDRGITVDVAGDANAFLGLHPLKAQYAQVGNDGMLSLDFTDSNVVGDSGVNDEGVFWFDAVFRIRNNGTENVQVMIDDDTLDHSDRVIFYGGSSDDFDQNAPFAGIVPYEGFSTLLGGSPNSTAEGGNVGDSDYTAIYVMNGSWWVELAPGEYIDIGVYVNTYDDFGDNIDEIDPDPIAMGDSIDGTVQIKAGKLN